ncbi:hypothetical protein DACRYDRAFT_19351 [Dacryopinax primogenitus]|uniref:Uncharacterized protein n=1 Tax=Dacryopinax primogenitus (strain DJM 731) TaxID=1858805 RepID=M5GC19_DACPD|nr:uncharacterized protein DACRYDRAFT_19351 [Dacryopinax primogenitus]EJU06020.1 hypothetical protein DACRYDRAFT_19351 [Dacryopinax primogenitus]
MRKVRGAEYGVCIMLRNDRFSVLHISDPRFLITECFSHFPAERIYVKYPVPPVALRTQLAQVRHRQGVSTCTIGEHLHRYLRNASTSLSFVGRKEGSIDYSRKALPVQTGTC